MKEASKKAGKAPLWAPEEHSWIKLVRIAVHAAAAE